MPQYIISSGRYFPQPPYLKMLPYFWVLPTSLSYFFCSIYHLLRCCIIYLFVCLPQLVCTLHKGNPFCSLLCALLSSENGACHLGDA